MFCNLRKKKAVILIAVLILLFVSYSQVNGAYLTTNRDTKPAPDKVTYDIVSMNEYQLLYETNTVAYYYREDRDILAIQDKRTGYTWKTGLDIPFNAVIDQQIRDAATPEEAKKLAVPEEAKMNTTYIGIANSLITVEYYEAESLKNISSASKDGVDSTLMTLNDNPATRRLDINFKTIELEMKVYITFGEDSITYNIPYEEITGKGKNTLVSVDISPFLGASGGKNKIYNKDSGMYDIEVEKYKIPGYVMVPDGSGSLIRFQDNSVSFSNYAGDVYGMDYSQAPYYQSKLTDAIPLKQPVMPVFGIAHGNGQAAFVAYADKGGEYMEVAVRPEENMTYYNWAYPRFVYNVNYFQVYNKKGDGYFTLMKEPNKIDIEMTYSFLAGDGKDGTPAADYTGMAKVYRDHLVKTGVLKEKDTTGDIPIRLDFMMADSKKSIVGTEQVVTTTANDVKEMLNTLLSDGIKNINSGLYGWQKNGETLAKPYKDKYSKSIGSRKEFQKLIQEFKDKNIDISQAVDYTTINKLMLNYNGTAARHVNSWYLEFDKGALYENNVPVDNFGFATPEKSAQWFTTQFKRFSKYSESMTVGGISNTLLSGYSSNGLETSVTDTIALYEKTFEKTEGKVKFNMEAPNMYLWKYTDRYLQSPVGTSQYVFETDAVPFLQLVLNGTMEMYAPYSNFSFYTQSDILRMIDYNLYPSFIVTKEPSYNLASTASSDLYSTEFAQYRGLIKSVYDKVNVILSQVNGFEWVNRSVIQDGVILNSYQKNGAVKNIVINYTEDTVNVKAVSIPPLSAVIIPEGGEK